LEGCSVPKFLNQFGQGCLRFLFPSQGVICQC
jgi:hypothetical protein